MALSMVHFYDDDWPGPVAGSHAEQGEIFERIAESSLTAMGWSVRRTGWASGQSNVKLPDVVKVVASHLNEHLIHDGMVDYYAKENEHGLDLVISLPFHQDERGGKPAFLVQCASGANEKKKRSTPDMTTWAKMIGFSSNPVRAFVVPFAYSDDDFFRLCSEVDGMVLERYRLLSVGRAGRSWMPVDLEKRIIETLKERLKHIDQLRAS